MLPWDPGCNIEAQGALMDRANPLRAGDINPITGNPGAFALPLRPAPKRSMTVIRLYEPNINRRTLSS